jgi:hypothetical protein
MVRVGFFLILHGGFFAYVECTIAKESVFSYQTIGRTTKTFLDLSPRIYKLTSLGFYKDDRNRIYNLALDVRRQGRGFFDCEQRTTGSPCCTL